jgi:hypothetical protein
MSFVGCSMLPVDSWKAPSTAAEEPANKRFHLSYRTESGRLNRMHAGRDLVQASFEQPADMTIPSFTYGTLTIDYPHPRGLRGYALVRGTFGPNEVDQQEDRGLAGFFGWGDSSAKKEVKVSQEVWETELPQEHLARLVDQLKEKQFFRRIKVLGTEAHLATDINGNRMSKDFAAVPELDVMLLNIRRIGRPSSMSPGSDPRTASAWPMDQALTNSVANTDSLWPPTDPQVHRLPSK